MALFKIMKGSKNRLNSQSLHEGYAWYTTEDAGFYVDASSVDANGDDVSGSLVRKKINDANNISISDSGISATNVKDAILEVKKTLSYDASTKTLTLS